MDATISDYLMPVKLPLNRYIIVQRFSEVDLRTSLRARSRSRFRVQMARSRSRFRVQMARSRVRSQKPH